ncbi:MAG: JAB domain-containing protein [bacterium]|nr:JAB domain-containing protein [bacterium]
MPTLHLLPLRERPVQRVAESGVDVCNLVELLAAIIGGARQIEIAHGLLAKFGSLAGLMQASASELQSSTPGLGPAGSARLKAALELGRRLTTEMPQDRLQIRSPGDVAQLLMSEMAHLEQEHFRVLFIDTRSRLIGSETVYVGSLNATHIRVSEVFREATRRNCARMFVIRAIIAVHNHPSGDPSPSPEDVEVTRQLVLAGQLLNIELLDHLVIGKQRYVSMRERGLGFSQ